MNKPNWKDAPEWAQYLAMDLTKEWRWFEGIDAFEDLITSQVILDVYKITKRQAKNTLEQRP